MFKQIFLIASGLFICHLIMAEQVIHGFIGLHNSNNQGIKGVYIAAIEANEEFVFSDSQGNFTLTFKDEFADSLINLFVEKDGFELLDYHYTKRIPVNPIDDQRFADRRIKIVLSPKGEIYNNYKKYLDFLVNKGLNRNEALTLAESFSTQDLDEIPYQAKFIDKVMACQTFKELDNTLHPPPPDNKGKGPTIKKPSTISVSVEYKGEEELNSFDLPPCKPSAFSTFDINTDSLVNDMFSIKHKFNLALNSCGYYEKTLYTVPNGFAMVAQIEQINEDASSKKVPDRWSNSPAISEDDDSGIFAFFKSLFSYNPGFYRIIVLIVTDTPISFDPDCTYTKAEAKEIVAAGYLNLDKYISNLELTSRHYGAALIYEFEQSEYDDDKDIKLSYNRHNGKTHLIKSELWPLINGY